MTYALLNNITIEIKEFMDGYEPYVVFANTGAEHPATLDFVHECSWHLDFNVVWLEALVRPEKGKGTLYKEVSYETASRDAKPYEDVIKKYGIPNTAFPHCTREMKLNPINAWAREKFGTSVIDTAIGIRADEQRRVSATADKRKIVYPLVDLLPTDKQDVLDFWKEMPFDLNLPEHMGNCVWCFKKSDKKLMAAMGEMPQAFDFPERMEKEFSIGRDGKPVTFFRGHRSTIDLRKLYRETGKPDGRFVEDGGCSESCDFLEAVA